MARISETAKWMLGSRPAPFEDIHAEADSHLARWGSAPAFEGRGIVTCLYDREFASGWVLLCELKRLGCTLPIEAFYRPGELSSHHTKLVQGLGLDLTLRELHTEVESFAIKVMAIRESRFRHVMWLDTDNAPIKDPTFLFDDPMYRERGALFWRDMVGMDRSDRWHSGSEVWKIFRVPPNDVEEVDSGQLLIDKVRCWEMLGLVVHYASAPIYYRAVHGDKDTFRLAWQYLYCRTNSITPFNSLAHSDFPLMPYGPNSVGAPNPWGKWGGGSVMQQRDRTGKPLFNHRTISKFSGSDNIARRRQEAEVYGPSEDLIYLSHLSKLDAGLKPIEMPPVLPL